MVVILNMFEHQTFKNCLIFGIFLQFSNMQYVYELVKVIWGKDF